MTLSSPYEGLVDPIHAAQDAWRARHRGKEAARALFHWTHSTADDGRPLHTGLVTCPNAPGTVAVDAVTDFVNRSPIYISGGVDQRPVLDFSVPGRIQCVWLLDGVWIELWAPDAPAPQTVKHGRMPGLTPAMADVLLAAATRPSGRLPFTRRTKTPKESPAA